MSALHTAAALLAGLLVAQTGTSTARAWCQMTTSPKQPTALNPCITEGLPLAWDRRCMEYAIDHRGSVDLTMPQVQAAVGASFGAWETVTCGGQSLDLSVVEGADHSSCLEAEYRDGRSNVNTIAFVSDWDERGYDADAYAITTVWHSTLTGEILDVDMQLNEQLGPFAICPDAGCPDGPGATPPAYVDLQNVVTHEAGHFFGVAHSSLSDATMSAYSARGETIRRSLTSDDMAAICAIYPPGSLPAECSYAPRGGRKLECGADAKGCSVSPGTPARRPAWLFAALLLLGLLLYRRR